MSYKFLIALLFAALGTFLQVAVGSAMGIWINFALATLIAASFFVNIIELIALVLLSEFILNWQPTFSFELLGFSLLPLAAHFARNIFPLKPWLINIIAISFSILIFYFVFDMRFAVDRPVILLWDIAASVVLGAIVFRGLGSWKKIA